LVNDTVEIAWKIFAANGTMVHSSDSLDSVFSFVLGAKPLEVIPGWDLALSQMYMGEISHLTLKSEYAFGSAGAPPLGIGPLDDITCEIEILDIIPSIYRTYKRLGPNESIKEDLISQLQTDSSTFSSSAIANRPTKQDDSTSPSPFTTTSSTSSISKTTSSSSSSSSFSTSSASTSSVPSAAVSQTKTEKPEEASNSDKDRKYFDEKKHKVDPNLRVAGEGMNPAPHSWEETLSTMEVEIPLFRKLTKSDVKVRLNYYAHIYSIIINITHTYTHMHAYLLLLL